MQTASSPTSVADSDLVTHSLHPELFEGSWLRPFSDSLALE